MKCIILLLCKSVAISVTDHNVCMSVLVTERNIPVFFKKIIKVGFLLETNFLLDYPQKLQ